MATVFLLLWRISNIKGKEWIPSAFSGIGLNRRVKSLVCMILRMGAGK